MNKTVRWLASATFLGIVLGCTSDNPIADSSQSADATVSDFPLAYIKRPIPLDEDGNPVRESITEPEQFNPGAVLFLKDRALPSAPERDISTSAFIDPDDPTTVPLYDVKDLSISSDGSKMVFAMRAPDIPDADDDDQPKWNIWEYQLETDTLRRIITSEIVAEDGHDIMPSYLADGRIVFASTRQRQSKAILLDEGKPQFSGQEESLNNHAFVLHVMEDDGSDLKQITFNQSHDYYPTLLENGRLAFLRWDNMGSRNAHSLYSVKPDGSDLQRLYGYHSQTTGANNSQAFFTKPLPMPNGSLMVLSKPQQSTLFGGDPVAIDVENYIEADQRTDGSSGVAQQSISSTQILTNNEPSLGGLYNSAFPLWDGSSRVLISWSPCFLRETDQTNQTFRVLPCTTDNLTRYANQELTVEPPQYGIWMWDRVGNTQAPIVLPAPDSWITEAVVFQERLNPVYIADAIPNVDVEQSLVDENVGVLHIRSVYDLDGVDTTPMGLSAMSDPTITPVDQRPARFLKLVKSVAIPDDEVYDFDGSAFGVGRGQLMREILGYAPIEPDGSVKVKVPANVPFTLSVLDQYGQRISTRHQNWMQVRPGEVKQCNGCHSAQSEVSHGRADADPLTANPGATMTGVAFPNTNPNWFADVGETMAEAYTRINGVPAPNLDIEFDDVWTDPALATPEASFGYRYQDMQTQAPIDSGCSAQWHAGCRITIHYEEHIQPLFDLSRPVLDNTGMVIGDNVCTSCHNVFDSVNNVAQVPAAQLELTSAPSPDEPLHMRGYRELFFGDNEVELINGAVVDRQVPVMINGDFLFQTLDINGQVIFFLDDDGMFIFEPDPTTGLPIELSDTNGSLIYLTDANGVLQLDQNGDPIPIPIPVPLPNQVTTTVGVAPILRGAGALTSNRFFNLFRTGSHQGRLSDAELRLIAEWLDLGAQYFNNPFLAPEN